MPDLPRRRRPPQRPSWMEPIAQRMTRTITVLVVADTVLFFAYLFIDGLHPFIDRHLALGPGFLGRYELWQPFTALFVHVQFPSWILNLIGVWFLGTLEMMQGRRRFLTVYLGAGVAANVAMGLVGRALGIEAPISSCSLANLAAFVALGRLFGRQPIQIVAGLFLQGRIMAALFVAFSLAFDLDQGFRLGDWRFVVGTLVASLFGFLLAAPGGL